MISILNLSKTFGTRTVLNNVSFTVQQGEIALLLGASGSGKSTLLRILNDLEQADSGKIIIDNVELTSEQSARNHLVGMVFQHFNLFEHMTVLENITFPLERGLGIKHQEAIAIAHALLKKYGLDEKAHVKAQELSGGQKQRLAIARTLALKPRIICMDEPTSALDPLLTNYVAQSIQDVAHEGYSVIVASHDTKLIEQLKCRIYLIDHGTIVEQGLSSDIRQKPLEFPRITQFIRGS